MLHQEAIVQKALNQQRKILIENGLDKDIFYTGCEKLQPRKSISDCLPKISTIAKQDLTRRKLSYNPDSDVTPKHELEHIGFQFSENTENKLAYGIPESPSSINNRKKLIQNGQNQNSNTHSFKNQEIDTSNSQKIGKLKQPQEEDDEIIRSNANVAESNILSDEEPQYLAQLDPKNDLSEFNKKSEFDQTKKQENKPCGPNYHFNDQLKQIKELQINQWLKEWKKQKLYAVEDDPHAITQMDELAVIFEDMANRDQKLDNDWELWTSYVPKSQVVNTPPEQSIGSLSQIEFNRIFDVVDSDEDGFLSFIEFLQLLDLADDIAVPRTVFKQLDQSLLTQQKNLDQVNQHLTKPLSDTIFAEVFEDLTGTYTMNGRISFTQSMNHPEVQLFSDMWKLSKQEMKQIWASIAEAQYDYKMNVNQFFTFLQKCETISKMHPNSTDIPLSLTIRKGLLSHAKSQAGFYEKVLSCVQRQGSPAKVLINVELQNLQNTDTKIEDENNENFKIVAQKQKEKLTERRKAREQQEQAQKTKSNQTQNEKKDEKLEANQKSDESQQSDAKKNKNIQNPQKHSNANHNKNKKARKSSSKTIEEIMQSSESEDDEKQERSHKLNNSKKFKNDHLEEKNDNETTISHSSSPKDKNKSSKPETITVNKHEQKENKSKNNMGKKKQMNEEKESRNQPHNETENKNTGKKKKKKSQSLENPQNKGSGQNKHKAKLENSRKQDDDKTHETDSNQEQLWDEDSQQWRGYVQLYTPERLQQQWTRYFCTIAQGGIHEAKAEHGLATVTFSDGILTLRKSPSDPRPFFTLILSPTEWCVFPDGEDTDIKIFRQKDNSKQKNQQRLQEQNNLNEGKRRSDQNPGNIQNIIILRAENTIERDAWLFALQQTLVDPRVNTFRLDPAITDVKNTQKGPIKQKRSKGAPKDKIPQNELKQARNEEVVEQKYKEKKVKIHDNSTTLADKEKISQIKQTTVVTEHHEYQTTKNVAVTHKMTAISETNDEINLLNEGLDDLSEDHDDDDDFVVENSHNAALYNSTSTHISMIVSKGRGHGVKRKPGKLYQSNMLLSVMQVHEMNQQITATQDDMRIRVVIRKRPISAKELKKGDIDIVGVVNNEVQLSEAKVKVDLTKYTHIWKFEFDNSFDEFATNEEIYLSTTQPLVASVFNGGSATCFAFGQTASGKTFTMMGAPGISEDDANVGIYTLVARDLFNVRNYTENRHLSVHVSFFEIYGGKLFDLLCERKEIKCLEDRNGNVQVIGLAEPEVHDVEEMMDKIADGANLRSTNQTGKNDLSSRSHAIMQFVLKDSKSANKEFGKFSIVDLAGSERGSDTFESNAKARNEGREINTSLLALKEVIRAQDKGKKHTPFRQSKLTQVLKDSFIGEKNRCVMIACIAPNQGNAEHSLNTLRYADRVKEKKTHPEEDDPSQKKKKRN